MADPLATADELKTHLGNQGLDDSRCALAVAGASGAVRAYCGWELTATTETFMTIGDGGVLLTLPTLKLTSVAQIRVDGNAVNFSAAPAPVWSSNGQIYWGQYWPMNAKIEVDAVHGYIAVPDLLRLVTLTVAARLMANPEGLQAMSVGSVSKTFASANSGGGGIMTQLDMRLLDEYRL